MDIPARQRFARYRGLKSWRTSAWDPKESLPPHFARLFAFKNLKRTEKRHATVYIFLLNDGLSSCLGFKRSVVSTIKALHIFFLSICVMNDVIAFLRINIP